MKLYVWGMLYKNPSVGGGTSDQVGRNEIGLTINWILDCVSRIYTFGEHKHIVYV